MVLWRSGRSRAPEGADNAWSRRASSVAGSRNLTLAAASSRASGSPASRQQIAATAAALPSSSPKAGETARARSTKSRPEGEPRTSSTVGDRVEEGNARVPTRYSCSPLTRRGARLVASTTRPGQASSSPATSGAAFSRCSKLSSTRSSRFSLRRARSVRRARSASPGICPSASLRPKERAMVGTTREGSPSGARATNATPSGKSSAVSRAAWTARRVLPTPPVPVRVSSRTAGSRRKASISSSSRSRPRSGVCGTATASSATISGAAAVTRSGTDAKRAARSLSDSYRASASDRTVCG